jgi:hypothetical protein
MDYSLLTVQVCNCLNNLPEDSSGSQLSHLAIRKLFNVLAQADAFNVVSNHENLFRAVHQVVQVNHAWMI